MKRFFSNLYSYRDYILYSAVALLRADVSGSFLNWLWWILDPLLFMSVYCFVALVVFGRGEPYFIPFVFLGYGMWQWINRSVNASVKLIWSARGVLSRVYLPKYILLFSRLARYTIQFGITLALGLFAAAIDKVSFTWRILYLPFVVLTGAVMIFGLSCVVMHCGVYIKDLSRVTTVLMKLIFYLSGVFYSVPRRLPPDAARLLLTVNPAAFLIDSLRRVIVYGQAPEWGLLFMWFAIGLGLSALGVSLVHRNERNYVKII